MTCYEKPALVFPSSHSCHISKQCDILNAIMTWPLSQALFTSVPSDSGGQDMDLLSQVCVCKSSEAVKCSQCQVLALAPSWAVCGIAECHPKPQTLEPGEKHGSGLFVILWDAGRVCVSVSIYCYLFIIARAPKART